MKSKLEEILNNVIDDFNTKWRSHEEKSDGIYKYIDEILALQQTPVRRRIPEWSEKEVECLMNYVEADDSETIYERLDFARYMLHYESGMDFPSRSMYDIKKKYYEECKKL